MIYQFVGGTLLFFMIEINKFLASIIPEAGFLILSIRVLK